MGEIFQTEKYGLVVVIDIYFSLENRQKVYRVENIETKQSFLVYPFELE